MAAGLLLAAPAGRAGVEEGDVTTMSRFTRPMLAAAGDFAHFSWPQGVTGLSDQGTHRFRVAASTYVADFDINTGAFTRLQAWEGVGESDAFARAGSAPGGPPAQVQLQIETPRGAYHAFGWVNPAAGAHLVEAGKYVTWVELTDLAFRDPKGDVWEAAHPRLELVFWADRVHLVGRVSWMQSVQVARATLSVTWPRDEGARLVESGADVAAALPAHGATVLAAGPSGGRLRISAEAGATRVETALYDAADHGGQWRVCRPGESLEGGLHVVLLGGGEEAARAAAVEMQSLPRVSATCDDGAGPSPEVSFDALRGWQTIAVPPPAEDPREALDARHTVRVRLENDAPAERRARLRFAMDCPCPAIGTCPMVCDAEGLPVGLPVQISKNWHGITYVHAHTVVVLPPGSAAEFSMVYAFEQWGGKPAASHAQLSLVGWDSEPRHRRNHEIRAQAWEEMALGIRGEHICYDPDVCQGRSFVDDMRALLSTDMRGGHWGFSSNAGGADFLNYWPTAEPPAWRWPVGAATEWRKTGPNLTETVYRFASADGKLVARARARSYATDDMTRAVYDLRYDVVEDMTYARLALFTLGADRYNGNVNRRAAQGDAGGAAREWALEPGEGEGCLEEGLALPVGGWFALYEEAHEPTDQIGGANRALVLRRYRAVLEGRPSGAPVGALRLNANADEPSVILDVQPAAAGRLQAGDFVEMQVEMVVYPKSAAHYHGPNAALRRLLEAHGDSWRAAWAAAQPVEASARVGTVLEVYPVRVRVDDQEQAEFTVSRRRPAWTPISVEGFRDYRGIRLETWDESGWRRLDQSVRGNDFWQIGYDADREEFAYIVCAPPGEAPLRVRASRR